MECGSMIRCIRIARYDLKSGTGIIYLGFKKILLLHRFPMYVYSICIGNILLGFY
jgi:hypothetical protein